MEENPDVTEPAPANFVALVMQALTERKFKPRCLSCGVLGWANLVMHSAPVITPTVLADQVLMSACLICTKCGSMKLHNLNALGLTLEQQGQRIVVPGQSQLPAPLILATG